MSILMISGRNDIGEFSKGCNVPSVLAGKNGTWNVTGKSGNG
jgi:hypothetical protein